jgi:ferrous iron transport protein B
MEMPSYRLPALRDVLWRMWQRGLDFLKTAGTVIFAMSIIIWALSYFPRPAEVEQQVTTQMAQQPDVTEEEVAAAVDAAYLEQSFLGRAGKTVQPVFAPAGFDWKTTVGVLASFPAREVIVSTLGITYSLGGDVDEENEGLIAAMQNARHPNGELVFTIPVALAVMVFFALCLQCGATVATIARESNWGWAIFAFTYMTVLAWGGAVITYQVGSAVMS